MNVLTQAVSFPAILLPAFIGTALLLAVLLRKRGPDTPWRYGEIVRAGCTVLALGCVGLAVWLPRHTPDPKPQAEVAAPCIEADMMVTRGNGVELWVNDWQHPAERLPVIAGQRHVYQFLRVPRHITLLRLDPTDVPDARIVIYRLTVKSGGETVRQFGPAELKTWKLSNVSPPKEQNGGLEMVDTTDDPILWALANIRLPEIKPVGRRSPMGLYYRSLILLLAALLLLALVGAASRFNRICRMPDGFRNALLGWRSAALVLLLSAGGAIYLQNQAVESGIGIEVDMLVTRGNRVELWLNDWQHPSEQLPVIAGERHVYRFVRVPQKITLLRLDPTDMPDARILIYRVTVRSGRQIFRQFGPAELKTWSRMNLSAPQDEDGGVALAGLTDDPILTAPLELQLPGGSLMGMSRLISAPDSPFVLAMGAFLMVLLARMFTGMGRMQAVVMAVSAAAAYPVVLLVMKLHLPPPAVTSTVGYASYHGYPKADEYLAAWCAMLVSIVIGYGFARRTGSPEVAVEEAASHARWKVWLAHAAVGGLVFVYFLPNLLGIFQSLGRTVYPYLSWDDENMLTWGYMVHAGLRPFRDFWYPYAGGYLQLLPFPAGSISWVLHATVVLWVLYVALFKVTGRRLGQALAVYGLVMAPLLMELLWQWYRYLLSIDVALLYVAICDETRLDWKTHVPFAAFVGYAFFCEPTQMVYAGAGIAAHTLLSALSRFQGHGLRERLRESGQVVRQRVVYVGIPMLAGIAVSLSIYAANGMLPGLWEFERSLGDQGSYGAVPSEISNWVMPILQPDTVFLLMFLLASYAVYRWAGMKGRRDPLGSALIVLCGTAFVAMQKQILRPHVMTQVRVFPYVALLIFGLMVWRERKPFVRMMMVAFLGCILGIAVHRNMFREIYLRDIQAGPGNVGNSIGMLLHDRNEFGTANATMYAPSRFTGFDAEKEVVAELTQGCGLRAEDSVYVLGDSSVFYILLERQPPYITNSYNDSPIYEQQRVLDWLQRQHPRFVIWGTDALAYDSVPHTVRLPLLYTYVVAHYQFLRAIGPYHILSELPPGQPPDLEYWRRVLGDRVDLGGIPGLARASEYADCGGDVARCDAVLVVKRAPALRGKLTVDIDSFRVQFDLAPDHREYVVNLNRLWFWNPLSRRSAPRITTEDAGAEAVMGYRRERRPVLY